MAEKIIPQDFYVYVHRKATTGEVFYVGKGKHDRAWVADGRSKHWAAIKKKHGIIVEIAQDGLQEWAAHDWECNLIALYGRKDLKNGMLINLTDGGEGSSGCAPSQAKRANLSKIMNSNEVKEKIRASVRAAHARPDVKQKHLQRMQSVETRSKLRNAALSAFQRPEVMERFLNGIKGRVISPEVKARMHAHKSTDEYAKKMSASIRAVYQNPDMVQKYRDAKGAKPVLCIELGLIFQTLTCAQTWLRKSNPRAERGPVRLCCTGKRNHAYGYTWRYA
jgi:hypothetical protein